MRARRSPDRINSRSALAWSSAAPALAERRGWDARYQTIGWVSTTREDSSYQLTIARMENRVAETGPNEDLARDHSSSRQPEAPSPIRLGEEILSCQDQDRVQELAMAELTSAA